MSLSFVSKSVQTVKDDGGFEEKPIEAKEGQGRSGVTSSGTSKSLFEQLRANQEQAEAEQEEEKRAFMRGTVELNEEDCAHIDALDRQRQEEEVKKQQSTRDALAAFRAAQADKLEHESSTRLSSTQALGKKAEEPVAAVSAAPAPILVVKKKRKRQTPDDESNTVKESNKSAKEEESKDKDVSKDNLGGLLTGYGSSDDDD